MGTGPVPMESVGAIWEAHWLQEPPRAEGAHPGYVGKKAQQNKSNTFSKRNHIKLIFNTQDSSIAKKKRGILGTKNLFPQPLAIKILSTIPSKKESKTVGDSSRRDLATWYFPPLFPAASPEFWCIQEINASKMHLGHAVTPLGSVQADGMSG